MAMMASATATSTALLDPICLSPVDFILLPQLIECLFHSKCFVSNVLPSEAARMFPLRPSVGKCVANGVSGVQLVQWCAIFMNWSGSEKVHLHRKSIRSVIIGRANSSSRSDRIDLASKQIRAHTHLDSSAINPAPRLFLSPSNTTFCYSFILNQNLSIYLSFSSVLF